MEEKDRTDMNENDLILWNGTDKYIQEIGRCRSSCK